MRGDSTQRLPCYKSAFPGRINTLQKPGNDLCGESYTQDVVVFTVSYHSKVMQNRTQEDNHLSIVIGQLVIGNDAWLHFRFLKIAKDLQSDICNNGKMDTTMVGEA